MSAQRVDSLRLVWLQAFLAVAGCRSHTEAAEQLGWNQSSVSRYIAQLEKWLGKTLFTGHVPVVISKDGKAFLPVATQVVDLLAKSRTPKAIGRKRPTSEALAREYNHKILKHLYKHGPVPGTERARRSGLSDEFLIGARSESIKLTRNKRPSTIKLSDIDLSFLKGAAEQDTDAESGGSDD